MSKLTDVETARFTELKEKGWINLNRDEKVEYKKFKDAVEIVEIISEKEKPAVGLVQIPKAKLDSIMARLSELEIDNGKEVESSSEWESVEDDETTLEGTMRSKDGKFCVGLTKHAIKWNERLREKEDIYIVKWLLPDDTFEEEKMVLKEFCTSIPRVKVKLLDKKVKTVRRNMGKTMKVEANYSNYKSEAKGVVTMYETVDRIVYTVLLPDGRKRDFPQDVLNS